MADVSETTLDQWIERMSLAQKAGQMTMAERMTATPDDVKRHALGAVLSGGGSHPGANGPADWVGMNDEFWQAAVGDPDSPGIPILFGVDAVHGHNNVRGATLFPHNIGLGAAHDVDLVRRIGAATAEEILATGLDWNFAPTLAVVRNCQWGRTYESFGDDPALVAAYGEAYVGALQGGGVIGCAKHWVGDGGTGHGIDQGETTLGFEALEATHVAPYYPALAAGVMSVMVSFNSWNGDKCHGHRFLVTELLKGKLGFDGIVVSDWDGIDYLDDDYEAAIVKSVNAGLDMFMVPERWRTFIEGLVRQVELGRISEARVDDAVRRILRVKARYGLFDMPRPALRPGVRSRSFGSRAHRDLAREAVRKSLVLLKNENKVLPLRADQSILVAGRNAHDLGHQCGGWTVSWQGEAGNETITGTSVWEGIRSLVPGAELSADLSGREAATGRYDAAVVVIGEKAYAEGMGDIRPGDHLLVEAGSVIKGKMNPLEPYARSLELSRIHPEDLACIQRIAATGVPVVTVLISGRPLIADAEIAASAAFVAAWLPGSEGAGVAEMLLGAEDFTGTLPLDWPGSGAPEAIGKRDYAVRFARGHGERLSEEGGGSEAPRPGDDVRVTREMPG